MGANSRFSWNEITAIATGVQALVVIVGSALALWQLRLALTARQMGGFLRLIDELEQGTVQETRRFFSAHQGDVRRIAQSGSIETLDRFIRRNTRKSKQQLSMSTVRDDFTRLEYAAMLCLNGMLPLKLERTYFTTVVALTWPDIQSTVLLLRKTRGNQYLQHFEALYLLYTSGAVYRRNYTRLRKREAQRLLLASRSIVEVSKKPRPGRSG
jgi:hypothetical protein